MLTRITSLIVAFSVSCLTSHAQQPEDNSSAQQSAPTTTLSLNANLVNLPVIVRDKKGAIVSTLTRSDFTLSVDGHAQTIRYFDRDQNLPLTIGLLVDTSQSQRSVLDEERTASSDFLDHIITTPSGEKTQSTHTADRAFILQFARQAELLQDLTSSHPKLQAAVKEIGTTNPSDTSSDPDSNDTQANGGRSHRGGGTALYDSLYLASNELMARQQGRKAVVILSDGVDRNSKESLHRSIEAAQRADLIVYSIYFKGQEGRDQDNRNSFPGGRSGGGWPGGGGGGGWPGGGYPGGGQNGGGRGQQQPQENRVDGKKILEQMSDETGGRMFEVKGKEKVADIYNQIAEELRSQYRLGYTPDATIAGDGYHRVDLEVPGQKNLMIQTRDGYYTGKDE